MLGKTKIKKKIWICEFGINPQIQKYIGILDIQIWYTTKTSKNKLVFWTCTFFINPQFQKQIGIMDMHILYKTKKNKINGYSEHANLT